MIEVCFSEYRAATSIVHGIAALIDHGNASQAKVFFSKEGSLYFEGDGPNSGEIKGYDNVAKFFEAREKNDCLKTRHVISNLRICSRSDSRILVQYICTVYRSTSSNPSDFTYFICDAEDQFIKENGDWKILRRHINPIFVS